MCQKWFYYVKEQNKNAMARTQTNVLTFKLDFNAKCQRCFGIINEHAALYNGETPKNDVLILQQT